MGTFTSSGKHVAQATIDFVPVSSLVADVEIDMSQPSSFGDITIFEKTVVELTAPKQKISATAKIVTPVYTTSLAAEIEGDAPVFKVALKSSATSFIVLLDYDLDASATVSLENAILSLTGKAVLTHADLTMDMQQVLTQAMSDSRLTLNVDITSPTFTDVNIRYAARKDGISASISTPSTGFLGLQLQGRIPSLLNARLYSRYASAPEDDLDILIIRATATEAETMNLKIAYNMDAPTDLLQGLEERLPAITTTLTSFAEKYHLLGQLSSLKDAIINLIEEAYINVNTQAAELSQLSILFRNTVVQYQKTIQVLLEAAVKFLRETEFKLPGSEEMTTLPVVLKQLTTGIATMLDEAIQMFLINVENAFNAVMDMISNVQVTTPIGTVMSGAQVIDELRANMKAIVDKAMEFVDTLKSDYLDAVAIYINTVYGNLISMTKNILDYVNAQVNMEQVNGIIDYVMELIKSV